MPFKSEKETAYWALLNLEQSLPSEPKNDIEWGTAIYRSPDPKGGYLYDFQWPPYTNSTENSWLPAGKIPEGAEEVAYCHTHPNNTYFSLNDTRLAKGDLPILFFTKKCTVYMVNQTGAYWYDGKTEFANDEQRKGLLWGKYKKKN